MRLLIVGTLKGQLTAATKIAMDNGATVTHAEGSDQAMAVLRGGKGADLILADVGLETSRARILQVCESLRGGLTERGWRIASPEPLRSGILAAVHPTADARAVAKQLEEAGVITAPREGAVRFSPHFYNDLSEVKRLLEAVDRIR